MYLIANSELPGISPDDLRMVAALARYHRRSEPKVSHPEFEALATQDREAILKLAALLRVADALDREHIDRVVDLSSRWEDEGLVLELETRGSLTLEEWALRRNGKMFRSVYGRPIRLEANLVEA
jgi:exopolyphosphatase/guanosine-5'-triphosphate,3'-diphosphate pyrophosphatase